ncbi:MAG: thiol:disulfide interchange protein DsbA/DsbL [Pseudomonadota bacterium]
MRFSLPRTLLGAVLRALLGATLAAAAAGAIASPTAPVEGAEYLTMGAPQPVQVNGKKIEVIEFFMYHCPHCNALEPSLAEWVKRQGENIEFKRVHFPYYGANDPEAHLYLTLEAMKRLDLHEKVFHSIHVERQRLNKDDAAIAWAVRNGIDQAKFLSFWKSMMVLTKLANLNQLITNYKVDSAPIVIIDGRYQTSPAMVSHAVPGLSEAQAAQAMSQVFDALVAKARKAHGYTSPAPAKAAAK